MAAGVFVVSGHMSARLGVTQMADVVAHPRPLGHSSRTRAVFSAHLAPGSWRHKRVQLRLPLREQFVRIRCDYDGRDGETAKDAPSSNGSGEGLSQVGQVPGPSCEVISSVELGDEDVPEEVEPLVVCLKRARSKLQEATVIREALEAEAQEVAQLAVQARETANRVQEKLEVAGSELGAARIVQQKLSGALQELSRRMDAQGDALRSADVLALRGSPMGTVELPSRLVQVGEGEEQGEWEDADEEVDLQALLVDKAGELEAVSSKCSELEARVAQYSERLTAAAAAAATAEEVAAAAMSVAETAVRDEMEAASVTKQANGALRKALTEIESMGSTADKGKADEEARTAQKASEAGKVAKDGRDMGDMEGTASRNSTAQRKAVAKIEGRMALYLDDEQPRRSYVVEKLFKYRGVLAAVGVAVVAIAFLQTSAGQALLARGVEVAARLQGGWASLSARIPWPAVPHGAEGIVETIWLLLTACIAVPLVCRLPGGSAVLGFLAGGAIAGPHALSLIKDVEAVRHIAELGVVFLLFNIGLELSLERLQSMQKFVFGMGSAQVIATMAVVAYFAQAFMGMAGPAAIILGGGLALSSTAVALQVLHDRGESGSRHGRATFSVLLFQDLAVVVLLMLVPLLAPSPDNASGGLTRIAQAIGLAGIKAVICVVSIIVGGRVLLRPMYRAISNVGNQELFSATTLLVVLGTSVLTQLAGLSLALGAFLAGLLLAETEYHLQVESDIAPFKGLLMGLFFMTVGMEISVGLFFAKWKTILAGIGLLIGAKTVIMAATGAMFGLSLTQATRAGLLLAPGGEFAFVLLGEALGFGLMESGQVRTLFLVVALSMALTPYLAEFGQKLGRLTEKSDVKALQPNQGEVDELRDHVIIAGYGRVGQLIAQLLSERMIPFVALDISADRVQSGKEADLPIYFGDAGSAAVLHSIGAHRASCAVVTLDMPGANYRTVWALNKNFPHVKTFVRAHDVDHGLVLEKAGATAVVPETLEPSLQLAAAVLAEYSMPQEDVANAIRAFRRDHLAELQLLATQTGSSLGYGFGTKDDSSDDEEDLSDFVLPGDAGGNGGSGRALPEPVA